jgi:hypothetical protein
MKTSRRLLFLGLLGLLGVSASTQSGPASYGAKVHFSKGTTSAFPDFELTYLGGRHVASKVYPRGFNYSDFKVSRGGKSITVSWSSGTGELGPQDFAFDGKAFSLELRRTAKHGWLKDDEVVIEKK